MDDLLYSFVGKRIRTVREEKGMSQEELAKLLSLGRTSITNIERGKQRILLHSLYEIAAVLGTEVKELIPAGSDLKSDSIAVAGMDPLTNKEKSWLEKVRQTAKTMKEA